MGNAALDGVLVFAPDGTKIGRIALPESVLREAYSSAAASATACSWPRASRCTPSTSTPGAPADRPDLGARQAHFASACVRGLVVASAWTIGHRSRVGRELGRARTVAPERSRPIAGAWRSSSARLCRCGARCPMPAPPGDAVLAAARTGYREVRMARWIRFEHQQPGSAASRCGAMVQDEEPRPTGAKLPLAEVKVLTPCTPSKMDLPVERFPRAGRAPGRRRAEPLYLLKSPSAFLAHGKTRPPSYSGNVVYEGELGIVISRRCSNVSEAATTIIFGYTCIDDVTSSPRTRPSPSGRAPRASTRSACPPGDRDRPRPVGPVDPHGARRPGAPELPGQRHDTARRLPVARHDALARRLRHLHRGERHARPRHTIEGVGTLSNPFVQQVPFRYAKDPPSPCASASSGAGAIGGGGGGEARGRRPSR